jgi:hypothetical protein
MTMQQTVARNYASHKPKVAKRVVPRLVLLRVERLPICKVRSLRHLGFRANRLEEIGELRQIAAELSGQLYAQRRVRLKRWVQSADPAYCLGCGRTRAQDQEKHKRARCI